MKKIIVAAAFASVGIAFAGPFGINQGMTLKELQAQGTFAPAEYSFTYRSDKVVKGHPDFDEYVVFLTPKQGVCRITAVGENVAASADGEDILKKYETLAAALEKKYGVPYKSFDFLKPDAFWTESRDLMLALFKHERTIKKYWIAEKKQPFPDSLHAVILSVAAQSTSEAYLLLEYEFKNFETCQQEVKNVKAKGNANL
jgi:hypothetical protein